MAWGSASGESLSLQRLGVLLTVMGDTDEAQRVMSGAIGVAERAAMRSHCLTRLHASLTRNRLAAGDLDAAEQSLREGLETARRHGHCVTCNALLLPEAVRVELALGRVDAAAAHADELDRTAASVEATLEEVLLNDVRQVALLQDDVFCIEAGERSVVLMNAMDSNTVNGCAGRFSQSFPPRGMG